VFLTAFSNHLERFDGNNAQVGIHGRGGASLRDPLGSARSNGCVRISNAAVSLLAERAREGTPVLIAP
jgi:lipoprotein-anchoring transpeptidase ErfK/SrfK